MTPLLIILGIVLAWWLYTIRYFESVQGEFSVLNYFGEHIAVNGLGIPEINIGEIEVAGQKIVDDEVTKVISIRVDQQKPYFLTGFPYGIAEFDYRYKRYKTIREIEMTGGEIRWQPTIEKDTTGKPVRQKNDLETIALGEWKEVNKKGLLLREREEIAIRIQSQDVRAVIGGYIKFLVWDMSLAISSTHNFKTDPEKAIIDTTQDWCRLKSYIKEIQGVSFETIIKKDPKFLQKLNHDIYLTGVIVEGIEFDMYFVEPESRDVIEAQEKIEKNRILNLAEDSNIKLKSKQGHGDAVKEIEKSKGQAKSIELVAKAKAVEITKVGKAENAVKVSLFQNQERIKRENEVKEFNSKAKTTLNNNGKILTKIGSLKRIPDATQKAKYDSLKSLTNLNTLILHSDNNSSSGDKVDELLENQIIVNQIAHSKKKED